MNVKCIIVLFALAFVAAVANALGAEFIDQVKGTYEAGIKAAKESYESEQLETAMMHQRIRAKVACAEIAKQTGGTIELCGQCCSIVGASPSFENTDGYDFCTCRAE